MLGRALSDPVCHHCSWQNPPLPCRAKRPPGMSPKTGLFAVSPGCFAGGRYQGSTAQKELLSLFLPPLTPTHSDGLFVVTSAASGGPWAG